MIKHGVGSGLCVVSIKSLNKPDNSISIIINIVTHLIYLEISFKNILMNLVGVRWLSTKRKLKGYFNPIFLLAQW